MMCWRNFAIKIKCSKIIGKWLLSFLCSKKRSFFCWAVSKDEGLLSYSHVSILRDSLFFHYLFLLRSDSTFPVLLSIA